MWLGPFEIWWLGALGSRGWCEVWRLGLMWLGGVSLLCGRWTWFRFRVLVFRLRFGGRGVCGSFWRFAVIR